MIEGSPARGGVLSIGLGYVRRNLAGTGGGNQLVEVVMMRIADTADLVLGAAIGAAAGTVLDLGTAADGDPGTAVRGLGTALGSDTGAAGFGTAVRDLGADDYPQYPLAQSILTATALAPPLQAAAVREPATVH